MSLTIVFTLISVEKCKSSTFTPCKYFKGAGLDVLCSEDVFVFKKKAIYYEIHLLIHIGIMQCET